MAKKLLACALALALLFSACAERIFEPTDAVDGKKRALEVFLECGFSAEYGDSTGCLQRWEAPIVICVYGEPTDEDWEQLEGFLMELSFRVPTLPSIRLTDDENEANVEMFFLTEDEREQLAARGIRPQDLGYVLFSHLDPDHIAGISEVRGAKRLLVPEEEYFWSCRINLRYTSRRLWIDEPPERFWYRVNHIGPESRSYDLFGDDSVHLVHIAGHTEGMFAALIRNGERYVLLNADGAASPRSWAEGTVPGICENSVRAKKALNWIGSMSRDPACVASLCSHDPDIAPQTIEF